MPALNISYTSMKVLLFMLIYTLDRMVALLEYVSCLRTRYCVGDLELTNDNKYLN